MPGYLSSKGGKRRRVAARLIACVWALSAAMLANASAQSSVDPNLMAAVQGL